jgi:hypothetical protein
MNILIAKYCLLFPCYVIGSLMDLALVLLLSPKSLLASTPDLHPEEEPACTSECLVTID